MISVCLATWNGADYVEDQLRSVLDQLSEHDEVVIADDGSRDDTLSRIAAFADARVRVLASTSRLGVVGAIERALVAARGEIIFLCDQDDVWLPGKVERCCAALAEYPLVVTDCRVVDAALQPLHDSFFALRRSGPGVLHNLWKNSYLGCCMAFRRELLVDALPFPARVPMHDMWLGLLAEFRGGVTFLPEPLLLYRRHAANASDAAGRSRAGWLLQLRWRGQLVVSLTGRLIARALSARFEARGQ